MRAAPRRVREELVREGQPVAEDRVAPQEFRGGEGGDEALCQDVCGTVARRAREDACARLQTEDLLDGFNDGDGFSSSGSVGGCG